MRKGTKLYSILRAKCPHCHEGQFFEDSNPYNFSKMGHVLPECPVCKRSYNREPGFYFGALYVSYALGVALFVSAFVATYVIFPEASTELYIAVVVLSMVLLGPVIYALSKIIWANMFYPYQGVERREEESAERTT